MIVQDFSLYEQYIRDQHDKGLKVSLVGESNRLYDEDIHKRRIQQAREHGDKVIYYFTPQYEHVFEIDPDFAIKMFGNKPKDSIYKVSVMREHTADLCFFSPSYIPYMLDIKIWLFLNKHLTKVKGIMFDRGMYAAEAYLGLVWKEKPDYIVSCPWDLPYNRVCYDMVNQFTVFRFLKGMELEQTIEV